MGVSMTLASRLAPHHTACIEATRRFYGQVGELPEENPPFLHPGVEAGAGQLNQHDHEIQQWLEDNNISEVECLVPDMTGNARGKFIPAHQFLSQ